MPEYIIEKPAIALEKLPVYVDQPTRESCMIIHDRGISFFDNVQEEYSSAEKLNMMRGVRYYAKTYGFNSIETTAYIALLWEVMGEFIDNYERSRRKTAPTKDLYVIRNCQGFIKIGITNALEYRIPELTSYFGGTWEVLHHVIQGEVLESRLIKLLSKYYKPVFNKHRNKPSRECVEDTPAVMKIIKSKINEYVRSAERKQVCIGS